MAVHLDKALHHADAHILAAKAHAVGLPPSGDQHIFRADLALHAAFLVAQQLLAVLVLHGLHPGAQLHADALLGELLRRSIRQGGVHVTQQPGQHLHHRHMAAEGMQDAGKLAADDAAADHRQALGHGGEGQELRAVDDALALQSGNGRHGVGRTGGDEDVLGLIDHAAAAVLHLSGGEDLGLSQDDIHLVLLQQEADTTHQLLNNAVLPGDHGGIIHAVQLGLDAVLPGSAHRVGHLRALKEGLGGDAADVQAGAAQVLPLHHSRPHSQLGGPDGGHITGGAAADHNEIILFLHGFRFLSHCARNSTGDSRYSFMVRMMLPISPPSKTR